MNLANRRTFFKGAAAAALAPLGAALAAAHAAGAEAAVVEAGTAPTDAPFLRRVTGEQDLMALCLPSSRIGAGRCYMLSDGQTVFGEGGRVNDGGGWREVEPGEFDGRVEGYVAMMLIQQRGIWRVTGSAYLAG